MTDIVENLCALHKRADNGEIIKGGDILSDVWNAIDEIKTLRFQIYTLEKLLSAYMTAQRPKAAKKG